MDLASAWRYILAMQPQETRMTQSLHMEVKNIFGMLQPKIRITYTRPEGECAVEFNASSFGRKSFKQRVNDISTDITVFNEINRYWEQLPQDRQARIFEYYRAATGIFQTHFDRIELTLALNQLVRQILDEHPFVEVFRWLQFYSNVWIPDVFDKEYIDSIDRQGSREQTYIRSEYYELLALALILRTVIPIWGEYISRIRDEIGNDFKEFEAFKLLTGSELLEGAAIQKLKRYIDSNLKNEMHNGNKVIKGITSEDFSMWLLSLICVRKLCVGQLQGDPQNPKAHLVSFVFQYITQKTLRGDGVSEQNVKDKERMSDTSELADKLSIIDVYKLKQNLSMGEIVELERSIKDIRHCAMQLCSNLNDELLYRCFETRDFLSQQQIHDCQVTLARWIMKPVISPRGLLYLPREQIIDAMIVTQAVLWAKGHYYLALLATAFPDLRHDASFLLSTDRKDRIPKELLQELDTLYPYGKHLTSKKPSNKPVNLAVNAIEQLTDKLSTQQWIATASPWFIDQVFVQSSSRQIPILPDLKTHLAQLIVQIGGRK